VRPAALIVDDEAIIARSSSLELKRAWGATLRLEAAADACAAAVILEREAARDHASAGNIDTGDFAQRAFEACRREGEQAHE
jgi:hypothetical protein